MFFISCWCVSLLLFLVLFINFFWEVLFNFYFFVFLFFNSFKYFDVCVFINFWCNFKFIYECFYYSKFYIRVFLVRFCCKEWLLSKFNIFNFFIKVNYFNFNNIIFINFFFYYYFFNFIFICMNYWICYSFRYSSFYFSNFI